MSNLLLRIGCYLIYLSARIKNKFVVIHVKYIDEKEGA